MPREAKAKFQTIFSSTLIELRQDQNENGSHFVVATQFWIYILTTLALMAVTLISTLLLGRHWSNRYQP